MKRLIIIAIGIVVAFLSIESMAQVVVVKPAMKRVVYKAVAVKRGYVWIPGHWKLSPRTKQCVWVEGHSVKVRPSYTWIDGHWQRVRRGWIWKSGYWKRI